MCQTAKFLILNAGEKRRRPQKSATPSSDPGDLERLDQMVGYCKTTACLRQYLLGYFGEHLAGALRQLQQLPGKFRGAGHHRRGPEDSLRGGPGGTDVPYGLGVPR